MVVYCVHGHNVSQGAAAALRARGVYARVLAGGIEGWRDAGGVLMARNALPHRDEDLPSTWVTHRRLKIDRLACPWLIRRFIDREARFMFVEQDQVAVRSPTRSVALHSACLMAAFMQVEDQCTCSTLLIERFALNDPALQRLAEIIRSADKVPPAYCSRSPRPRRDVARNLRHELVMTSTWRLNQGMYMYDALYAWQKHAADETYNWPKATFGQGAG